MSLPLRILPCTPIVFNPIGGDPQATAIRYTQYFGKYDHIVVQGIMRGSDSLSIRVYDVTKTASLFYVNTTKINLGGGRYLHTASLPTFNTGVYYLMFGKGDERLRSVDFEILDDDMLGGEGLLFEYSNSDNDTATENMFIVNGVRQVFRYRVRGGFKPQGYQPQVAQESYRTQRQELRQLYSAPYDKWTLTVGGADGVPVEYVRLLNSILSCNMIYINGQRWCRSEGAVPEKTLVMQGAQTFNVQVDMERQLWLENYPKELYAGNGDYNGDYNNDYDK